MQYIIELPYDVAVRLNKILRDENWDNASEWVRNAVEDYD